MDSMALQTPTATGAAGLFGAKPAAGTEGAGLADWFAQLVAGLGDGSTGSLAQLKGLDRSELKSLLQKAAKGEDISGSPLAALLPAESTAEDLRDVQEFLAKLMATLPAAPPVELPIAAPEVDNAAAGLQAGAQAAPPIVTPQPQQAAPVAPAPIPQMQQAAPVQQAATPAPQPDTQPAAAPAPAPAAAVATPLATPAPVDTPAPLQQQAEAALLRALQGLPAVPADATADVDAAAIAAAPTPAPGDAAAATEAQPAALASRPAAAPAQPNAPAPAAAQQAGLAQQQPVAPAPAAAPAAPSAALAAEDAVTVVQAEITAPAPIDRPRAVEEKAAAQLDGRGSATAGNIQQATDGNAQSGMGGEAGSNRQDGQQQQRHGPPQGTVPAAAARADAPAPAVSAGVATEPAQTAAATASAFAESLAAATPLSGDSASTPTPTAPAAPAAPTAASAQPPIAAPAFLRSYGGAVQHPPAMEQLRVQVAHAVSTEMEKLSIRLRPDDLGGIDIQLAFSGDGRVMASVQVEKAETLELLRMDARQLERSLQDAGLQTDAGSLSFSLKDDSGAAGNDAQSSDRHGGGFGPAHRQQGYGDAGGGASDLAGIAAARAMRAAAAGRLDVTA